MTRVQCQHGYWVNPLPRFTGAKADIFRYSALESRATDPIIATCTALVGVAEMVYW